MLWDDETKIYPLDDVGVYRTGVGNSGSRACDDVWGADVTPDRARSGALLGTLLALLVLCERPSARCTLRLREHRAPACDENFVVLRRS